MTARRSALLVGDSWEGRNVLAAARDLAECGWRVGVASSSPGLAAASRTTHWHALPAPADDFATFERELIRILRSAQYDVVLAGGDAEVMALTYLAERLPAAVPYPSHGDAVRAFDKWTVTQEASAAGVGTPWTALARDAPLDQVTFPVVVKARLHWAPGRPTGRDRLEAVQVTDRSGLESAVAAIESAGGEAILQQPVMGRPTAYVALVDRAGQVVVEWQQDGHGTWPFPAGVWTRAQTVRLDPELASACQALLRRLGWFGLVQLQFLIDSDGTPKLIDFNGRFYASGGLPLAAGIHIADLWARMGLGQGVKQETSMPVGMRYQWLVGDLLRALAQQRGGLPRDLRDCARYRMRSVHSTWRATDPMPAIRFAARHLSPSTARRVLATITRTSS